jgi:hypothetical protein
MERAYLLGTIASMCGTGSMDLLVDEPLLPAIVCALTAALLMRLIYLRVGRADHEPGRHTGAARAA